MSVIVDNGFCVNTVGFVQKTSLALVVTGASRLWGLGRTMRMILWLINKKNCSSLFMCIPRHLGCNGELNCLEGDASDETGCKSTSRMIMLMIMMIMIMVNGGGGYDFLPRHPTLRSFHDWWRCFNNHPCRECCVSLSGFFSLWLLS